MQFSDALNCWPLGWLILVSCSQHDSLFGVYFDSLVIPDRAQQLKALQAVFSDNLVTVCDCPSLSILYSRCMDVLQAFTGPFRSL